MASKFFKSFFPTVKAQEEEDLVDPQDVLREKCSSEPKAASLLGRFQECNDRVNAKKKTTETCEEELFDFLNEVNHCVTKKLFSRLR